MDLQELAAWLFTPGARDIFRFEMLPGYISGGDEPHYTRWCQGLPVEADDNWSSWLDRIATDAAAGIVRRRVHWMTEPLSDHNLFECAEQYTRNGAAGEQIRCRTVSAGRLARMTEGGVRDFWMRDRTDIAVMEYDAAGRFQSAWIPSDPHPWLVDAEDMWNESEPFTSWWAARPQYHGQRVA